MILIILYLGIPHLLMLIRVIYRGLQILLALQMKFRFQQVMNFLMVWVLMKEGLCYR